MLGVKNVDENFYNRWSESYKQIRLQPSNPNKQKALDQMHNQIETDITLLGATAIEDKLQAGVPQAINDFRKAGIKVWMLTGDKKETAENISISCKLIGPNSKKYYIDGTNQNSIRFALLENRYKRFTILYILLMIKIQIMKSNRIMI